MKISKLYTVQLTQNHPTDRNDYIGGWLIYTKNSAYLTRELSEASLLTSQQVHEFFADRIIKMNWIVGGINWLLDDIVIFPVEANASPIKAKTLVDFFGTPDTITKLDQIDAIRTAYLDLVGAMQAYLQNDINAHDWNAHKLSIQDLENSFRDILYDIIVELTSNEN